MKPDGLRAPVRPARGRRLPTSIVAAAGVLGLMGLGTGLSPARAQGPAPAGPLLDVVVHVADLPRSALYEFDFWTDSGSPGGRLVGTPNTGDELDPPPENDPHVRFRVRVQGGVPYRCWIHMKVGKPKGKSRANLLYVQFTDAVDREGRDVLRPATGSYLAARGPAREGWTWVGCDSADGGAPGSHVHFRASGEVTVRVQAGMEGVGFDQFLLSPVRFLSRPPSEAVVAKPPR
jgi:hypothetical protein